MTVNWLDEMWLLNPHDVCSREKTFLTWFLKSAQNCAFFWYITSLYFEWKWLQSYLRKAWGSCLQGIGALILWRPTFVLTSVMVKMTSESPLLHNPDVSDLRQTSEAISESEVDFYSTSTPRFSSWLWCRIIIRLRGECSLSTTLKKFSALGSSLTLTQMTLILSSNFEVSMKNNIRTLWSINFE